MKLTPLYMREEIFCRTENIVVHDIRLRTWLVFGVPVFRREHVLAVFVEGHLAYQSPGEGEAR